MDARSTCAPSDVEMATFLSDFYDWDEELATFSSQILFPGAKQQPLQQASSYHAPGAAHQGLPMHPTQPLPPFRGMSPAPYDASAAAAAAAAARSASPDIWCSAAPLAGATACGSLGALQDRCSMSRDCPQHQHLNQHQQQHQQQQQNRQRAAASPFAACSMQTLLQGQQQQQWQQTHQQQQQQPWQQQQQQPWQQQQQQVLVPRQVAPQGPPSFMTLQQQQQQQQLFMAQMQLQSSQAPPLLWQQQQLQQQPGVPMAGPDITPQLQQLLQEKQQLQQQLQALLQTHQQQQQRQIMQQPTVQQQQQPQLTQQQQPQQLQPAEGPGHAAAAAGQSNTSTAAGAAAGQSKRRGRPPKVPGQFCKGYDSIKRYREKKKGMVSYLEAEVAQKQSELHRLLAEQEALLSQQQQLEASMSEQHQRLAQLLQLQLLTGCKEDSGSSSINSSDTVTMAATAEGCSDTAATQVAAAAAAGGAQQPQHNHSHEHSIMEKTKLLQQRYRTYVQAVADRLAQGFDSSGGSGIGNNGSGSNASGSNASGSNASGSNGNNASGSNGGSSAAGGQQQFGGAMGSAAAAAGDVSEFPPFPFTFREVLSLGTLGKQHSHAHGALFGTHGGTLGDSSQGGTVGDSSDKGGMGVGVGVTPSGGRNGGPEGGGAGEWGLNLATGQHDFVTMAHWKRVAQQIPTTPDQLVQLRAAWRVYVTALCNLNKQRVVMLLQLQQAINTEFAGEANATAARTAGQPNHQQQQQQQLFGVPGSVSGGTAAAAPATAAVTTAAAGAAEQQQQQGGGGFQPSGGFSNSSGGTAGSSSGGSMAGRAAAGGGGSGALGRDSDTSILDVSSMYIGLLDDIERNLQRSRAVVIMFNLCILRMLSAEQVGRICLGSWPYFPLTRAVLGYMLGKEDLMP